MSRSRKRSQTRPGEGEGKPSKLLVRFVYNYGEGGNPDETIPEVDGPPNGHHALRNALGLG